MATKKKKSPAKKATTAARKPAKKAAAKKAAAKKPAKKAKPAAKKPAKKAATKAAAKKPAAKKAATKKATKKPATKATKKAAKKAATKAKAPAKKTAAKKPAKKAATKAKAPAKSSTTKAASGQKTIVQHVFLPAPPSVVFRMLTDPTEHGAFTGTECSGEPVEGGAFTASSGYINGRYETLEQDHLIVAAWQTSEWPKGAPASRLEFVLEGVDGGTELTMTHAELPPSQAEDYRQGWLDFYWTPMRAALTGKE
jgi:activator of HSP90 ATPase